MAHIIVVGFSYGFSIAGKQAVTEPLKLSSKETGSSVTVTLKCPNRLFWQRRLSSLSWEIVVQVFYQ